MSSRNEKKTKSHVTDRSSDFADFDVESECLRQVDLSLTLIGEIPGNGDFSFLLLFNEKMLLEQKWKDNFVIKNIVLPLNLKEESHQSLVADKPLMFLLRAQSSKTSRDIDPLLNSDNRAGANVDLYPLVMGEKKINITVPLLYIDTALSSGCFVEINVNSPGDSKTHKIPLMITMVSAHCLPGVKEGTAFISGLSIDGVDDATAIKFGMSLSTSATSQIVWSSVSNAGHGADSAYNVPIEDTFIPNGLTVGTSDSCQSFYWNAMHRVLVDPEVLQNRLNDFIFLDIAGVPKSGKIEVRGRYIALIDAGVLLQPGQTGVNICAKLIMYNVDKLPEKFINILDLPPISARGSSRENDHVIDEYGHDAYIILRMDLLEPLKPKSKITSLFDLIGFTPPCGVHVADDALKVLNPPQEPSLDRHRISTEGGALLVHKELSDLAQKSTLQMSKSIKRMAANRLLSRVRTMLKSFPPTDCSQIDYQDIVTSQHAVTRRAVLSSFAPLAPKPRPTPGLVTARSRIAGDTRIAARLDEANLQANPNHPRILLSKVLRSLEGRNDSEALNNINKALSVNSRNRYLLWTYGGIQFDKGLDAFDKAAAAFRIAVKGDTSDGTSNAIGWAALHALHHFHDKHYAAYVAAKKMRRAFELPTEWRKCLKRWIDTSGEEETFWVPSAIDSTNPLLIAAAFFLCLRCFKLAERLIKCVEDGCYTRGAISKIMVNEPHSGICYLRVASLLLRQNLDLALEVAEKGIKRIGPCDILTQIYATCLAFSRGWDGACESAFNKADSAGGEPCPALLIRAALGGMKTNIQVSLQRAARAHKIALSAHTALVIGRIYCKMGDHRLAERWAAAAVNSEPLLSDGWALLSILALYKRDINLAKALLRSAKQAGPINPEFVCEINRLIKIFNAEDLADIMTTDLCLCDYI